MYIFKAGVVGAGFMGAEIAQVITYAGLPVVLKDIDQEMLDTGMDALRAIYQRRVDKGKMTATAMQEKVDLAIPTLSYDEFADVDIVIEAVPENMKIKQQVFAELDEVCPAETIFASNTSALSIQEMGSATKRPHKVVGLHFFSPAHLMKLVEVVRSPDTGQETVDDVVQFSEELRKIPVVVKECPGFLVNRILVPYLFEAILSLQEGAATASEVDSAMTEFGWPMGPFTLMDMIGVGVAYHTAVYMASQKEGIPVPPLLEKLYQAGRLGEKAGAGFYGYGDQTDEPVKEMIKEIQAQPGAITSTEFSVERLMLPLVNEAALCAMEEIANINDIGMACIAGLGMQVRQEDGQAVRMGPLEYADSVGLDVVVEQLEDLEKKFGPRFHPVDLLYQKVKAGELGKKTGQGFMGHTT
ncbi:MAG: 3-hydroxyacyl-CoA dehydrogenase [Anaerolineales bacterium]|nr:MAG: 3-hydroxyacyl-CoA dehydrogenase [Anaerolineales bacterium]